MHDLKLIGVMARTKSDTASCSLSAPTSLTDTRAYDITNLLNTYILTCQEALSDLQNRRITKTEYRKRQEIALSALEKEKGKL